jgi:protein phosphatase
VRLILVAVAVLVLLAAGGIATYNWALGHWFVGVQDDGGSEEVAVFRGLDASIIGLELYRLDHATDLALSDLNPAARNRVRGGIPATDASDADRILDNLRHQRLPLCPRAQDKADRTTSSTAAPTTTPTGAPDTSAGGTATNPTETSGSGPGPTGTPTSTSATRSTTPPEPGVDCREAK